MSDHWLEHGHETDGSDLTPVFSSSSVLAEGAGVRPPATWTSGWRAVVVGGGLALLATLGVVGVANAIGDNLFPSMGSTSPASVWQNPVPPADPTPTTVVVSSTSTTVPTAVPTTNPTTVPSNVPSTSPTTAPTTAPSSKAAVSPSSSVATSVSPTTSTPDLLDDDSVDDDPSDDDPLDDDSGGSSGSGSGSDDSGDDSDD